MNFKKSIVWFFSLVNTFYIKKVCKIHKNSGKVTSEIIVLKVTVFAPTSQVLPIDLG